MTDTVIEVDPRLATEDAKYHQANIKCKMPVPALVLALMKQSTSVELGDSFKFGFKTLTEFLNWQCTLLHQVIASLRLDNDMSNFLVFIYHLTQVLSKDHNDGKYIFHIEFEQDVATLVTVVYDNVVEGDTSDFIVQTSSFELIPNTPEEQARQEAIEAKQYDDGKVAVSEMWREYCKKK